MLNIVIQKPKDVIDYLRSAQTVKDRSDIVKHVSSTFLSYKTINGETQLKLGDKGQDIQVIQSILIGLNYLKENGLTGTIDSDTMNAIKKLGSRFKIVVDVNAPISKDIIELLLKMEYGLDYTPGMKDIPQEAYTDKHNWPQRPSGLETLGYSKVQQIFGPIEFVPRKGRYITITNDFVQKNIITIEIPQLAKIAHPVSTKIRCHRLVANQMKALWQTWENVGLLDRVKTYNGLFVPRYLTGSRTTLSNHAFGIAFDINSSTNGYGVTPPALGEKGCVRELVPYALDLGFFWGGFYRKNKDGMHFEVREIKNPNIIA
jgi:hypothetical protein